MENFKTTLNKYIEDTYLEFVASTDQESLKMIRDMAYGVILYCFNSGIISDPERTQLVDKIDINYSKLWLSLLNQHIQPNTGTAEK